MSLMQRLMARPIWLTLPALIIVVWLVYPHLSAAYVDLLGFINVKMREFHQMLSGNVRALAAETSPATTFALIGGSFLYGVLHAAGPGHGKVILSTYLLSQPEQVKRSVVLACAAALVQGLVAIMLVYGLFYIFGLVSRDMKNAVSWSERLAYLMVIAIGISLAWRGLKAAHASWRSSRDATAPHLHDSGHSDHSHHSHHGHNHVHDESGVCTTCGHAHVPSQEQVARATDWRTALGIVLSIGMRPCTGAVLVLVFARFSGVSWAGALAVLAMSVGTAITVSLLAVASVGARGLALRFLGTSSSLTDRMGYAVSIAGGLVIGFIGLGLFAGSFNAPMRSMGL